MVVFTSVGFRAASSILFLFQREIYRCTYPLKKSLMFYFSHLWSLIYWSRTLFSRFGIGRFTTEEEIDYTVERTIKHVKRLREMRLVKQKSGWNALIFPLFPALLPWCPSCLSSVSSIFPPFCTHLSFFCSYFSLFCYATGKNTVCNFPVFR